MNKLILFSFFIVSFINVFAQNFVKVNDGKFTLADKNYNYIGTNYWYGALLATTAPGKERLIKELDLLQKHNITNLRIVAAAEGEGNIITVPRIAPATQPQQGIFSEEVLQGLDFLLSEMAKRNMKAVLYLSNNWEWSGGFLQYLLWNKKIEDSVLQRKISWDETRDMVSKFYSCEPCINDYLKQVQKIISRTNTLTKIPFVNDTTIMAWQLANEPRPMRPEAIEAYKKWIATTAATIKKLDSNHLISIGTEGYIGTENKEVFTAIHANENIDYTTIHIWPKNWQWYNPNNIKNEFASVVKQTKNYIQDHIVIAEKLNKPLVIEEFGFPRDEDSFSELSTTKYRNKFYKEIFKLWQRQVKQNGPLQGLNFWAFGGMARPKPAQIMWKKMDDYMGDPPMEQQGLYSVFDCDKSTWQLINQFQQKK